MDFYFSEDDESEEEEEEESELKKLYPETYKTNEPRLLRGKRIFENYLVLTDSTSK